MGCSASISVEPSSARPKNSSDLTSLSERRNNLHDHIIPAALPAQQIPSLPSNSNVLQLSAAEITFQQQILEQYERQNRERQENHGYQQPGEGHHSNNNDNNDPPSGTPEISGLITDSPEIGQLKQLIINLNKSLDLGNLVDFRDYEPVTPVGDRRVVFRYFCPLCFYHYKFIYKTGCCGHYVCLSCALQHIQQKAGISWDLIANLPCLPAAALPLACPHCNSDSVSFLPVEATEKVRNYNETPSVQELSSNKSNQRKNSAVRLGLSQSQPIPIVEIHEETDLRRNSAAGGAIEPLAEPNQSQQQKNSTMSTIVPPFTAEENNLFNTHNFENKSFDYMASSILIQREISQLQPSHSPTVSSVQLCHLVPNLLAMDKRHSQTMNAVEDDLHVAEITYTSMDHLHNNHHEDYLSHIYTHTDQYNINTHQPNEEILNLLTSRLPLKSPSEYLSSSLNIILNNTAATDTENPNNELKSNAHQHNSNGHNTSRDLELDSVKSFTNNGHLELDITGQIMMRGSSVTSITPSSLSNSANNIPGQVEQMKPLSAQ
jgi:hypothetical protein